MVVVVVVLVCPNPHLCPEHPAPTPDPFTLDKLALPDILYRYDEFLE